MLRRTFLQGATASFVAAPFGAPLAQNLGSQQTTDGREPTIIYNEHFETLRDRKINPLDTPPELLGQFGLPRPPAPSAPGYDIWQYIFERPLIYAKPLSFTVDLENQTNPRFQQAQIKSTRYETSQNWAGSYVHPRRGNMMFEVSGSWTIPDITKPAGLTGGLPPASSIWIGLDGQRLYIDSSLPQIGTRQEFRKNGIIAYFGWYQWWVRDQPLSYKFKTVPIILNSKDRVFCIVQASGLSQATVTMVKLGSVIEWWSTSISPEISPYTGQPPLISGATAEWVVERPASPVTGMLHPLPQYHQVEFADCAAREAVAYDVSSAFSQNLYGARFIQMFDRLNSPARIVTLSRPQYLASNDKDAFKVSYTGP